MVVSFVSLLVLAEALPAQPAGPQAGATSESSVWQDVLPIISKHKAVFGKPPGKVPRGGVVDGPLLGNGDVGVVLSGAPDAQRFWISKCDFWKAAQAGPRVIGGLDLRIPALAGAAYHAEQIIYEAEIRSTFRTADGSVAIRSWVAALENLLVIELTSKGKPVGPDR
jgi:alpha-L-fucosidase 2